jgi:hypothetical protein
MSAPHGTSDRGAAVENAAEEILKKIKGEAEIFKVGHIHPNQGGWDNATFVVESNGQEKQKTEEETRQGKAELKPLTDQGITPQTLSCDFILVKKENNESKFCFVEVKGTTDTMVELTANQYESATTYEGQYFILVIRYSDELLAAFNEAASGGDGNKVKLNIEPKTETATHGTGTTVTGTIVANWVILKVSEGSKISKSALSFGPPNELSSRVVTALKIKHGLEAVPTKKKDEPDTNGPK